jgi:hypothetical protein
MQTTPTASGPDVDSLVTFDVVPSDTGTFSVPTVMNGRLGESSLHRAPPVALGLLPSVDVMYAFGGDELLLQLTQTAAIDSTARGR